ncbi:MAG: hypothetical protein ACKESC_01495 [Candidatus Hodgkinia cicadicola]
MIGFLIQPHNRHYIVYTTTFREPLLNGQTNWKPLVIIRSTIARLTFVPKTSLRRSALNTAHCRV